MEKIKNISPEWILRIALGIVYIYSGYGLLVNPDAWMGFAPQWFAKGIGNIISFSLYIRVQGVVEILFAVIFFTFNKKQKIFRLAAFFSALEMLFILLFSGIDEITFRDIGLLGGSLSLYVSSLNENNSENAE